MLNTKITLLTIILFVSSLTVFGQSNTRKNIAKLTNHNAAEFTYESLAVKNYEFRTFISSGLIAGKIEVSDTSWKTSGTNPSGWNTASFNDASWSQSFEQGVYGISPWNQTAAFPTGTTAKWIWSTNTFTNFTNNTTVYFRKTFTPNVSSAEMKITADDSFTAYLNGVQVAASNNWTQSQDVTLKLNVGVENVIAVEATNGGGQAGVLAHIEFAAFATPPPVNPAIENAYWNAVQAGDTLADYQSYLSKYPNGKYEAIAELRIKQINRFNPPKPSPSPSTAVITPDVIFLNKWAVEVKKLLPLPIGDVLLNDAEPNCKFGCIGNKTSHFLPYLSISATTPKLAVPGVTKAQIEPSLKSTLAARYCSEGADKQNIAVEVLIEDMNKTFIGNFFINPGDCTAIVLPNPFPSSTPNNSTVGTSKAEEAYWNAVKSSKNVSDLQGYIITYPTGEYVPLAKLFIRRLDPVTPNPNPTPIVNPSPNPNPNVNTGTTNIIEEQFWNEVKNSKDANDFQSYLDEYPSGKYTGIARLEKGRIDRRNKQLTGGVNPTPTSTPRATPTPRSTPNKPSAGQQMLANAVFGSINEMIPLSKYWILTENDDLEGKSIISSEIAKVFSKLSSASRIDDADVFILFVLTDQATGNTIPSNADTTGQSQLGDFIVFTSDRSTTAVPTMRILFKTRKTRFFSNANFTFNRHPATNATREFMKELQKINY